MGKSIYLLLISLLIFGCKKNTNVPLSFDYGSIKEDMYDNTFFKFKFPVNPDWYVLDNEETDMIYKVGTEIAAGENNSLKKKLEASDINLAKLFTAFREEPGTNIQYNPSLVINAENLKNAFSVKSTLDYLVQAKKILEQTEMQIEYIEEKEHIRIGSQDFSFIKLENTFNGLVITQDYYVTIKNGFALLVIMSYVDEEGKTEAYEMFNKLKI
jgi:hypothetical protein